MRGDTWCMLSLRYIPVGISAVSGIWIAGERDHGRVCFSLTIYILDGLPYEATKLNDPDTQTIPAHRG